MPDLLLPRLVAPRLANAAAAMPVAVLMGARQTGKSTLVRDFGLLPHDAYLSLDARAVLDRARSDPDAFVAQAGPDGRLIIDEVQRAPALVQAIKLLVDEARQRIPGQFLLTGSANLLLMKQVTEPPAGRASYVTVWPMTRREQLGFGAPGIWSELLATPVRAWRDLVLAQAAPAEDWRDLARRGGYPRPAVHLRGDAARAEWFAAYVDTYLERDLPELSPIAHRSDFRRLMQSLALRVGTLANQTQLAREAALPQTTVQRYLKLLETSYQLVRLPAYAAGRVKRLIKTPKLFWSDTGLAMHLSGERDPRGAHLENIVAHDLLAWRQTLAPAPSVMYWRTTTGREVDFVVEAGRQLLPIEVKAANQPSSGDLGSMRAFMEDYRDRAPGGLVLYGPPDRQSATPQDTFWIAEHVLAAPWWRVL